MGQYQRYIEIGIDISLVSELKPARLLVAVTMNRLPWGSHLKIDDSSSSTLCWKPNLRRRDCSSQGEASLCFTKGSPFTPESKIHNNNIHYCMSYVGVKWPWCHYIQYTKIRFKRTCQFHTVFMLLWIRHRHQTHWPPTPESQSYYR